MYFMHKIEVTSCICMHNYYTTTTAAAATAIWNLTLILNLWFSQIRHQLETLLAEKARLANENETYSRENRFLREIVEYHQLTMQDVVYLDEGMEEVTELYPMDVNGVTRLLSVSPHSLSPTSPDEVVLGSAKDDDDKSTSEENETPASESPPQHAAKWSPFFCS